MAIGLVNTAAYAFQFPATRLAGRGSKITPVPRDYYDSLLLARAHTSRGALLIDPIGDSYMNDTLPGMMIAERRVFSPGTWSLQLDRGELLEQMSRRKAMIDDWIRGGLSDQQTGRELAASADVLIAPSEGTPDPQHWRLLESRGGYSVYLSQLDGSGVRGGSPSR